MIFSKKYLIFFIIFFTYLGYYTMLLTVFNLGQSQFSRYITIPLRLLISLLLVFVFLKNITHVIDNKIFKYFLFFVFIYILRIFTEVITGESYYLGYEELFLYFFSFVVIPFFVLSRLSFNEAILKIIFKALSLSALLFSIVSAVSYFKFIGKVSRLSTGNVDEAVVSPLVLSYCSSLIIGFIGSYLVFNKTTMKTRLTFYTILFLSLIPYFLGASRGSLITLFFPIIILVFSRKSASYAFKGLIFIFLGIVVLVVLDSSFGSGLVDRYLSLETDLEEGNSSVVRIEIWKTALEQFVENPIFGDKMSVNNWASHPHNILVEALMTTGVLGFFPLMIVLLNGFKIARYIFREHIQYAWIPILFLQNFFQNMFSGALHSATWLFTSLAILFSTYAYLKNKDDTINYIDTKS